jgi:hypothetical protein
MEFFKFISQKDKSLNKQYDRIKYKIGKKIEIKDADMDRSIQFSTGIHCISMEDNSPINYENVSFGPRVAILKAKEEDVIFQAEDGLCRLRKCQVVDIIYIEDLPDNLKTGRNSPGFFTHFLLNIKGIQHKQEYLDFILDKCCTSYIINTVNLYLEKLDRYYPEVEEYLLDKKLYDNAICYAICKKQYTNPIIRDKVLDDNYNCRNTEYKYSRFGWVKVFPEDKEEIEKLMNSPYDILKYCETMDYKDEEAEKFTEKISQLPYDIYLSMYVLRIGTNDKLEKDFLNTNSLYSILRYAVRYNKNTEEIRNSILRHEDFSEYEDFVKGMLDRKEIKDIALLSPKLAYQYILLGGEPTQEIKDKIKESSFYTLEYFKYDVILYKLDKDMFPAINDVGDIIYIIRNFDIDKDFFKAISEQDYLVYSNEYYRDSFVNYLTKYKEKHIRYKNIINEILEKELKYQPR